jgi:small GTP-binding protein
MKLAISQIPNRDIEIAIVTIATKLFQIPLMSLHSPLSPDPNEPNLLVKIILTGESGSGKTNLLSQFVRHYFSRDAKSTIGAECATKTVQISDHIVKAQIWDTAGQERFRSITSTYYHGAHGVLLVYDITNYQSFKGVSKWLVELDRYAEPSIVKMLIGNKSDLADSRSVPVGDGQRLAETEHLLFLETSAKTAENVNEAFVALVTEIVAAKSKAMRPSERGVASPGAGIVVKEERKCC